MVENNKTLEQRAQELHAKQDSIKAVDNSWMSREIGLLNALGLEGYFNLKLKAVESFLNKLRENTLILTLIMIGALAAGGTMAYITYTNYMNINAQAPGLSDLKNLDTQSREGDDQLKTILKNSRTYTDLINSLTSLEKEKTSYEQSYNALGQPFTNLLTQLYLPSLNIWKHPYTDNVDIDLLGEKFLENNPYNDIHLIQSRSKFFKDMGANQQYNEIDDIQIGGIQELNNGFFKIPITVAFSSPDKRSFLFLVDKISMSSSKKNVSLINEFSFYLRNSVRKTHQAQLSGLLEKGFPYLISGSISEDKLIGSLMRHRIRNELPILPQETGPTLEINENGELTVQKPETPISTNSGGASSTGSATGQNSAEQLLDTLADEEISQPIMQEDNIPQTNPEMPDVDIKSLIQNLITPDIIQETIAQAAACPISEEGNIDMEDCMLRFREKFRSIPQLAYGMTLMNLDRPAQLRMFYANIPPLLTITTFNFAKQKDNRLLINPDQVQYRGQIVIDVYGRSISEGEYATISNILGKKCLGENKGLSIQEAQAVVEKKIVALATLDKSGIKSDVKNYLELQTIFTTISNEIAGLGSYKKTIRLFEIYRMLNDNGLCK